jgi:peptide/nickel transport system permease protein
MARYIVKRIIFMLPVLLLLSIIVFIITQLTPGSPVDLIAGPLATQEVRDRITAELGLDQPLPVQYFKWLSNLLRGNMGRSIISKRPVSSLIVENLPMTLELGLFSWLLAYAISIPLGIISAVKQYSFWDNACMLFAIVGVTIPDFWLSLMLILFFGATLRWFPIAGYGGIKYLILPSMALALGRMALLARIIRASMLEVLNNDYIRTARAKGIDERNVIVRHGFRNALLPIISIAGLQLGYLLGGAVIVETIFARPGLGRLIIKSISSRDFPVVQGTVLVLGISILIVNLITDLTYAFIDPRIRYA